MANFDKYFDSTKLNYRPAFVYRKSDFFFIIFYFRDNILQPFKRYRKTFELNRIADINTRAQAADIMALTVTDALRKGWNPDTDKFPESIPDQRTKIIFLPAAIEKAHDSILIRAKDRTVTSYNSHKNAFIEYLKVNGKYDILPFEFGLMDARIYQDHLSKRNYAGKTVNTKTDYASGLFDWMNGTGILESNPFEKLKHLPENESEAHELFTYDEIDRIKKHLMAHCPQLWQFALFIYYCYMRPASIIMIKRSDIDLTKRLLTIESENHKNNRIGYKELLPAHIEYLEPFIKNIPGDNYLFSNSGNLTPGTKRNYPTRASEQWHELIKIGLGIDKNMYGLKHTGAAHFLELNKGEEPLKWLQMQMSHSDLQTTSIYTNKLKIVKVGDTANIPKI